MKKTTIILMVLVIGFTFGRWSKDSWEQSQIDWENPPEWVVLPTIPQIQKIIGAKVDGKWGDETDLKFDEYQCNLNGIRLYEN